MAPAERRESTVELISYRSTAARQQQDGGNEAYCAERRAAIPADGNSQLTPTNGSGKSADLSEQVGAAKRQETGGKMSGEDRIQQNRLIDTDFSEKSVSNNKSTEPFHVVWRDLALQVSVSPFRRAANKCRDIFAVAGEPEPDHVGDLSGLGRNALDRKQTVKAKSSAYIFRNINGHIRSGEITAILGPSGVGKTSLLEAICGFETSNYTGSIQLVGGRHKKRMNVSIIPQKDYLIDNLTVYENLSYSSRIQNVSKQFDHEANIERVVKVLNLVGCVDNYCKNLSGGQYKRVSIAQELLRQPDILVLDEPTSGLDSLNCEKLMETLRDLVNAADNGTISPIAIVMTIHQPDVEIYSMFDHVYCLASGGRVVYDGHPSKTLDVLRTRGGVDVGLRQPEVVSAINPANLLVKIASQAEHDEHTLDRLAAYQREQFRKSLKFVEAYQGSTAGNEPNDSHLVDIDQRHFQLLRDKRLNSRAHKNRGLFWYHTGLLTKRSFLGTLRDPMVSVISLLFHLAIPLVMWFVFSPKIGTATSCPKLVRDMSILSMLDKSAQSQLFEMLEDMSAALECSTMFFLTTYAFVMCCVVISSLAFPLNMHILLKELRNGWYGMSSYVLGKTIASFPFEVIFPSISLILVYYMLGMPSSYMQWRMVALATVMALVSMIATTQGLVYGALFMDNTQAATFFAVMTSLPATLLSGFAVRINNMPAVMQYITWINPIRYACDMMSMIRFGYGICPCDAETEYYLKNNQPRFTDLPASIGPVMKFYLSEMKSSPPVDNVDDSSAASNATLLSNSSLTAVSYSDDLQPYQVPGINYDFVLNSTQQDKIISEIDGDHIDFAGEFAKLFTRSLGYGREINDCKSARAQTLASWGIIDEEWLPWMFGILVGLLALWKLILYLVVRYKIETRL